MLRDRRRRVVGGLVCLVCLTMPSGCKIEFEANTDVASDGTVTRTTRYVADGAPDKRELEERYILLPGGTWETKKVVVHNAAHRENEHEKTTSIYQVTKRYTSGQSIPSDCVRKGKSPDRTSRNEVHVRVRNYVFVKTFDYEERFRDITSVEGFETTARKLYTAWLEYFAGQLVQELEDRVTLAQAKEALRTTFDPLFSRFMALVRDEGVVALAVGSKTFEQEIVPELKTEQVVNQVFKVLPPPSGEETELWREAISRAFEKANDIVWNLSTQEEWEEELFGVYGFDPFQTYGFKVFLSLPGKVVKSNATKQAGNMLTWEFDEADFQWRDYVLKARSQLVYAGRIALAVGMSSVIFGAWGLLALRRRKRGAIHE